VLGEEGYLEAIELWKQSFELDCHTFSRFWCYLMPKDVLKKMYSILMDTGESHAYVNSVACANKVFPLDVPPFFDIVKRFEIHFPKKMEFLE
jgi:hypothetical protein